MCLCLYFLGKRLCASVSHQGGSFLLVRRGGVSIASRSLPSLCLYALSIYVPSVPAVCHVHPSVFSGWTRDTTELCRDLTSRRQQQNTAKSRCSHIPPCPWAKADSIHWALQSLPPVSVIGGPLMWYYGNLLPVLSCILSQWCFSVLSTGTYYLVFIRGGGSVSCVTVSLDIRIRLSIFVCFPTSILRLSTLYSSHMSRVDVNAHLSPSLWISISIIIEIWLHK